MSDKPVNIFWTGGWDSTFRFLYLLIKEEKTVQPYFVVRPQDSVGYEIKTMNDIRRQLFRKYPHTKALLKPTEYIDIRSISENEQITNTVTQLNKYQQFAMQYDFCSRYCKQMNIYDMELSNEKGGRIQSAIQNYLVGNEWRDSNEKGEKEEMYFEVFKYFKFPLLDTTKLGMKKIAKDGGWDNLLEMTWFCASPYKGKPCGFCGPCTYVIDEGLSRRLPFFRRILSKIHMPARRFYRNRIKYGAKIEQRTGVKN